MLGLGPHMSNCSSIGHLQWLASKSSVSHLCLKLVVEVFEGLLGHHQIRESNAELSQDGCVGHLQLDAQSVDAVAEVASNRDPLELQWIPSLGRPVGCSE